MGIDAPFESRRWSKVPVEIGSSAGDVVSWKMEGWGKVGGVVGERLMGI